MTTYPFSVCLIMASTFDGLDLAADGVARPQAQTIHGAFEADRELLAANS
jgi:hypothetical protein